MLVHFILFPIFLLFIICLGEFSFYILSKAISLECKLTDDIGLKGIIGLFFLGMIGVVFNFFLPLSSIVFSVAIGAFFVAGGVILIKDRSDLSILQISSFVLISLILAPLAGSLGPGYDGGLYHLPYQLWLRSEPIVVGIANLHGRFGFGSLLEYTGASLWINEQFTLLSYLQASFLVFFPLFLLNQARLSSGTHLILLLGVSVNLALFHGYLELSYTYTDLPAGFLFATAFVYGHWLLYRNKAVLRGEWAVFSILLLAAIFYKVSSILLLSWFFFVFLYRLYFKNDSFRECLFGLAFPVGLLIIWLIRNVLTTGCLVYPEAASCLDVSWSAYKNAVNDANWVTAWARHPGSGLYSLQDSSWFFSWWLPNYKLFISELITSGLWVGLLYTLLSLRYKFICMKILDIRLMAAAGFVLLIFLFWFWKAPTPRFGVGVFVLFFPVLFLFFHGKALYMSENMSKLLQATVAIGVLVFICRIGVPWGKITSGNMMTFNYLTAPKPPTVKDKVFGVRPAEGDQCWLVPDCAPNSRPPKTSQNGRDVFYSN